MQICNDDYLESRRSIKYYRSRNGRRETIFGAEAAAVVVDKTNIRMWLPSAVLKEK